MDFRFRFQTIMPFWLMIIIALAVIAYAIGSSIPTKAKADELGCFDPQRKQLCG